MLDAFFTQAFHHDFLHKDWDKELAFFVPYLVVEVNDQPSVGLSLPYIVLDLLIKLCKKLFLFLLNHCDIKLRLIAVLYKQYFTNINDNNFETDCPMADLYRVVCTSLFTLVQKHFLRDVKMILCSSKYYQKSSVWFPMLVHYIKKIPPQFLLTFFQFT